MIKIAVLGVESTGKSTLTQNLAQKFDTIAIDEFARSYLEQINRPYTFEDINLIAEGQKKSIEQNTHKYAKKKVIFADTELLVVKIWAEFVFGKCPTWIENEVPKQDFKHYLLTDIDLPWQKDHLREYPDFQVREKLHQIYLENLIKYNFSFSLINGLGEKRLEKAAKIVEEILKNTP